MNLLFNVLSVNREFSFRNEKFDEEIHDFNSSEIQIKLAPPMNYVYAFGDDDVLISDTVELSVSLATKFQIECFLIIRNKDDYSEKFISNQNLSNKRIGNCFYSTSTHRLGIYVYLNKFDYDKFLEVSSGNKINSITLATNPFEYSESDATNHHIKINNNWYPILKLDGDTQYSDSPKWELVNNPPPSIDFPRYTDPYVMTISELSINLLSL